MSLIDSLKSEIITMVGSGFIAAFIGLCIFGVIWKLLSFNKEGKSGYIFYNEINICISCFIIGFVLSMPGMYNRITEPYYSQLENIMIYELKKNNYNPDSIPLNEFNQLVILKKSIVKSIYKAAPFAKKELSETAADLIPEISILEDFEKKFKGKESLSVTELIDFLKNSVKDELFSFIPYLTFFLILELVGLFFLTWLTIRNEEKKQVESEKALADNRILL